jgi:galactokinase
VPSEVRAFAPGRVNLIGEHTDYNGGLALPFAIAEGVTVRARAAHGMRIRVRALDMGECDEFVLSAPRAGAGRRAPQADAGWRAPQASVGMGASAPGAPRAGTARAPRADEGWRLFVRGLAAELPRAGVALASADLEIRGEVPRNAGLSSSAALEVALGLALLGLAGAELDRRELARVCSRVESEWVGAHTGLLDQLASLFGEADAALCIDFSTLAIQPVPLVLTDSGDTRCARIPESTSGWRLVTLDSGESRTLAASGYNERRAECVRACELLGVGSLREAREEHLDRLPDPLARRVMHVLGENARVLAAVRALREGDLRLLGALLDASHASLRDLYECSTPTVEATVRRMQRAGAVGARMVGGGFGGHVLGLFAPGVSPPARAREVRPSRGAHLLAPEPH